MRKLAVLLAPVLILALVMGAVGCGGGGNDAGTIRVAEMMKVIPHDSTDFSFDDIGLLRGHEDMEYLYQFSRELFEENMASLLGESAEDIEWMGDFRTDEGRASIYAGRFEVDEIEDMLRSLDYEEDTYEGQDVWNEGIMSAALTDDFFVWGLKDAVQECLDVWMGRQKSLYDVRNESGVLRRLPYGAVMAYGEWGLSDTGFLIYRLPESLVNIAVSKRRKNENNMEVVVVLEFDTEDAASYAKDNLGQLFELDDPFETLERWGYEAYDVTQEEQYITIKAVATVQDVLSKGKRNRFGYDWYLIDSAVFGFYLDVHSFDDASGGWNEINGTAGHYYPTANGNHSALYLGDEVFVDDYKVHEVWSAPNTRATTAEILDATIWMGLLINEPGSGSPGVDMAPGDANSPLLGEDGPYLDKLPASCSTNNYSTANGAYTWIAGKGMVYGVFEKDGFWYAGFNGGYP